MSNWSRGVHPASLVLDSFQYNSSRMHRLNALASLAPAVWCQFSIFKGRTLVHVFPFWASTFGVTNGVHATTFSESGGGVAPIVSQQLYFFNYLESPLEFFFFDSSLILTSSQDY